MWSAAYGTREHGLRYLTPAHDFAPRGNIARQSSGAWIYCALIFHAVMMMRVRGRLHIKCGAEWAGMMCSRMLSLGAVSNFARILPESVN